MAEPSVAMATVVANSNSTVETELLVAFGSCWSWVGMKKGMKPLAVYFRFSWRHLLLRRVCVLGKLLIRN